MISGNVSDSAAHGTERRCVEANSSPATWSGPVPQESKG